MKNTRRTLLRSRLQRRIGSRARYVLPPARKTRPRASLCGRYGRELRRGTDGEWDSPLEATPLTGQAISHSFASAQRTVCDLPGSPRNSARIASRNATSRSSSARGSFPHFPVPEGSTADEELAASSRRRASRAGPSKTAETDARVDYELGIIARKGYAPYFLVVADLLRHAREKRHPYQHARLRRGARSSRTFPASQR